MDENKEAKPKKLLVINEQTVVPISFLILVMIGVVRTESTAFKANANADQIKELKDERTKIYEELKKHGEALARVETALGTKTQNQVAEGK